MFIATLVAVESLSAGDISAACDAVQGTAGPVVGGIACDVRFAGDTTASRTRLELLFSPFVPSAVEALDTHRSLDCARDKRNMVDVIVQIESHRARKLLVADMDSTMITVECIDELADYAGLKGEVSVVTERAMRGEIDFAGALSDRVALLAGLTEATVAECLRERVKLMGGAKQLVQSFRRAGGTALLVSGGFTHFTGPVAAELGFDRAIANRLIVKNGVLTGKVEMPIVDAQTKKTTLVDMLATMGLPASASIAIGDGANDIPMIEAAGLGIAYHAKPKTQAAADACVRFGDLNMIRYALAI